MEVQEALSSYATQLVADGRARNTVDQVRRHGRMFASWLGGGMQIEAVTHEHVARFLASDAVLRRADGGPRKPTSGNSMRSSMRTFLAYCHGAGYMATNAGRMIRRARCSSPAPKALSDGDREKLLAALEEAETPAEIRDRVLITVLLTAGPRIGSTLAADVQDFDAKAGTIYLRATKNGSDATVFLPLATAALLAEHVGARTDGPLFVGVNGARLGARQAHRRLAQWARRAGIERAFGPHTLRHCFAIELLKRTGNVVLVGRALSHRSLGSTMTYARVGDDQVRAAVGA